MLNLLNPVGRLIHVAVGLAVMGASICASAQGIYAYPAAGQSQKQQAADSSECRSWAYSQTGFDPSQAPPRAAPSYSAPPPQQGGLFGQGDYGEGGGIRDAGKGAAGGALFGAIAGNAGAGAAIGAVSGLFIGGVKRSNAQAERDAWERQQAEQQARQQQAINAEYAARERDYMSAYKTCMAARDYQVN